MTAEEVEGTLARLRQSLSEPDGLHALDVSTVQSLLTLAITVYAAKAEAGEVFPAFAEGAAPAASDVCLASTQMLDAVSVEIFELALWRAWAGASD